jgi:transposase-like protein
LNQAPQRYPSGQTVLGKALDTSHTTTPRVINVDWNPAYPKAIKAIDELKAEDQLPQGCQLRPVKYLNNIIEQDHRFIKRLAKAGLGFSLSQRPGEP